MRHSLLSGKAVEEIVVGIQRLAFTERSLRVFHSRRSKEVGGTRFVAHVDYCPRESNVIARRHDNSSLTRSDLRSRIAGRGNRSNYRPPGSEERKYELPLSTAPRRKLAKEFPEFVTPGSPVSRELNKKLPPPVP